MSWMKTPKYTPPPPPAPPANAPQMADSSVAASGVGLRQKAASSFGQTLATSPGGVLTDARTDRKTLLGQ